MTLTTPKILLGLTDDEYEALRDIAWDWLDDGFLTPPYTPAIQSVLDMLDMENYVPHYLRSHEPPRNSGEGTAVDGPMPLEGESDANERA